MRETWAVGPIGDGRAPAAEAISVGFMLVAQFSMIAFTSAIEPLRLANRAAGRELYRYSLWSEQGGSCAASNGIEVRVSGTFAEAQGLDMLIVCGGLDIHRPDHRALQATLRRSSVGGAAIGAVCTGTYVLAKAGLLDGYRATIHWENRASLASEYDALEIGSDLFEIDRNRFTCAGGTAAADMMLSLIVRDHGPALASDVADQLIHHRIREAGERQRMDLRMRLGIAHPKLLQVVGLMEETFAEPLGSQALADTVHLSRRQLERLFLKYLGCSPARHYLSIRLEHARRLIRQSAMPLLTIAIECGFTSASHFSKAYVDHFGRPPSAERKLSAHQSVVVPGPDPERRSEMAGG
ncbi:GlxA family transcriptional regulator [Methylobacterium pseudosasicola]|uniref:Transcriptional regulator GlxA family, contains an amidase domain and an AraC-type DNA-binding HTH domain n=1 Tax=Methylobacterium pseudosasicola TaxID=582667 RepID=A0A1I4GVS1_9HYPH|nr:GlxA family transcriptional regulator [Methylobacterium pseudosasicola]SFL34029.1 Transcriptional regulator GlxA family, contains an amidase domain and an AraC-type DNA-binding HTH domain [Methylobacterium pseudosasicola]